MKTFSEGDKVLVSVGLGGSTPGVVDRPFDGTGKVYVLPEGKAKARPFPPSKVRLAERRALPAVRRARKPAAAKAAPKPRNAIAPPPLKTGGVKPAPSRYDLAKPPLPARDEAYLTWVRMHPCAACQGRKDMEAHHWAPRRGAGQKVSDYFTVPLCMRCHRHFHDTGSVPCFRDAPDPAQATRQLFAEREAWLLERWTVRQRARRAMGGVA